MFKSNSLGILPFSLKGFFLVNENAVAIIRRLHDQIIRQNIDVEIAQITLTVRADLQAWQVNTQTPQVEILLFHFAMALGRIKRGGCAQALHRNFYAEIETSAQYSKILQRHRAILARIPFFVPESEQTHFIANLYSLSLAQPAFLME